MSSGGHGQNPLISVGGCGFACVGQMTDSGLAQRVRVQRREEKQEKRKCCRKGQSAADSHPPFVVQLEQHAGGRAPHYRYQVFGSDKDAYHGGRKPQLSEEQGKEGQEAGTGAADQEVEEAGQRQGAAHVDLLGSSHGGG